MNKQLETKEAQTKPELYTVLVAGLTMEQYLKKETALKTGTFWGTKYEFTPYLLDEIIGDGLQLCYLGSIDSRPYYWLMRIDSKTDVYADDFDFEDLLQPIEDECGRCDNDGCERCEENGTKCEYPAISWGGGHWGMVANFATGQDRKVLSLATNGSGLSSVDAQHTRVELCCASIELILCCLVVT